MPSLREEMPVGVSSGFALPYSTGSRVAESLEVVVMAKMIRYRCSPYRKRCRFGIGSLLWHPDSPGTTPHNEKSKPGFRGEYVRKTET